MMERGGRGQEFAGLWAGKLLRQNRLLENGEERPWKHELNPALVAIAEQQGMMC